MFLKPLWPEGSWAHEHTGHVFGGFTGKDVSKNWWSRLWFVSRLLWIAVQHLIQMRIVLNTCNQVMTLSTGHHICAVWHLFLRLVSQQKVILQKRRLVDKLAPLITSMFDCQSERGKWTQHKLRSIKKLACHLFFQACRQTCIMDDLRWSNGSEWHFKGEDGARWRTFFRSHPLWSALYTPNQPRGKSSSHLFRVHDVCTRVRE